MDEHQIEKETNCGEKMERQGRRDQMLWAYLETEKGFAV